MERRAHMNIHDVVEIRDEELSEGAPCTRDRFGKRQALPWSGRPVLEVDASRAARKK